MALKELAAGLGIRPPSVLFHLTSLERLGLVERYRGKSQLTAAGTATYLEYQRHHRVAEALFAQVGLPPGEVCRAAREIDLVLAHRTVEQLCRAERHPRTCPHGDPIPPCRAERPARR